MVNENRKVLREKVKCQKFSAESENFCGNRGKSETGGKCIIASWGMDAPERGDLGQEITFIDKIRKIRLTWFGHVTRMENSRLPAVKLYGKVEGTRSRGRQPKK